jgi:uncharacterized protein (DUF427 family)
VRLGGLLKRAVHAVGLHRIATRPLAGRVRVMCDGVILAQSDRAIELRETGLRPRYYLPPADVRLDLLTPSATTSHCPFKGDAVYYSAPGARDAFWTYAEPVSGAAEPIAGMLAPRPGRLDITVERPRA